MLDRLRPLPLVEALPQMSKTDWSDLSARRKHVVLSILLIVCGLPTLIATLVFTAALLPSPNPLGLFLVIVAYSLVVFGYYAVSFLRLVWWRCPSCGNPFFGTTLFECMPFGNSCHHCQIARPRDGRNKARLACELDDNCSPIQCPTDETTGSSDASA